MDKDALVTRDLRIGRDVIGLLNAANLPVEDAFWAYVPQVEEWRLVLSSPLVKELGVRTSYLKMSNALHKSPLWQEIPLGRISLFAPDDDVIERLKALEKYRYEGAIEIIKNDSKNGSADFLIFFAPYRGPGGALPTVSLSGKLKLQNFLSDQIGMSDSEIDVALRELDARGSYSLENLQLTTSRLRKLGLLHRSYSQRSYRKQ